MPLFSVAKAVIYKQSSNEFCSLRAHTITYLMIWNFFPQTYRYLFNTWSGNLPVFVIFSDNFLLWDLKSRKRTYNFFSFFGSRNFNKRSLTYQIYLNEILHLLEKTVKRAWPVETVNLQPFYYPSLATVYLTFRLSLTFNV